MRVCNERALVIYVGVTVDEVPVVFNADAVSSGIEVCCDEDKAVEFASVVDSALEVLVLIVVEVF